MTIILFNVAANSTLKLKCKANNGDTILSDNIGGNDAVSAAITLFRMGRGF